jgi:GntR family transcriptional regulator/MocR family aminotransferase
VRLVYLEPPCHFPTAARLAPERRACLLDLARRHGFFVIEDDSGHVFNWTDSPDLPLAAADTAGRVVHVGTVSPLLLPDLQMAYLVAGAEVVDQVAALRQLSDPQGYAAAAAACGELLRSGELAYHTRRARRVYEQRRALLAGLLQALAPGVPVRAPAGGLAFWLPLPPALAADHLHVQAAERGLLLAPAWYDDRPAGAATAASGWHLRLPFGSLDDDGLRAGVERLAQLLA